MIGCKLDDLDLDLEEESRLREAEAVKMRSLICRAVILSTGGGSLSAHEGPTQAATRLMQWCIGTEYLSRWRK